MAFLTLNFYSRALNKDTTISVLLPEDRLEWPKPWGGRKLPVLYILHGHCQDHMAWIKSSRVEWYLRRGGSSAAAVFVDGDREFYVDGVHTHMYQTYIAEELPVILRNYLPITDDPDQTFIGGQSMGGYGSLNIALNYPDNYGGILAFSAAIDNYSDSMHKDDIRSKGGPPVDDEDALLNMDAIFGGPENYYGSKYDLYACLEKTAAREGHKPRIYLTCGTEDFFIEDDRAFAARAKELGMDITYVEGPGMHDWDYWDAAMVPAFRHFGLIR